MNLIDVSLNLYWIQLTRNGLWLLSIFSFTIQQIIILSISLHHRRDLVKLRFTAITPPPGCCVKSLSLTSGYETLSMNLTSCAFKPQSRIWLASKIRNQPHHFPQLLTQQFLTSPKDPDKVIISLGDFFSSFAVFQ